jgi:hypothetical protein
MREFARTSSSLGRADLETYWEEAKPLIQLALEGSGDTVEEVLQKCLSGAACLLASDQAFVVVEQFHEPDGPLMIVWAAASRIPGQKLENFEEAVDEAAKLVGAKRILFWAFRPGFSRILSKQWKMKCMCWVKEV